MSDDIVEIKLRVPEWMVHEFALALKNRAQWLASQKAMAMAAQIYRVAEQLDGGGNASR